MRMKHKHFKHSKPLCMLCGWLTRNKRKWVLKNNGLHLCRYCRQDYILQAKTPASSFALLPDSKIEKHHKVPTWELLRLEKPRVRTGITSPFSPRKKSEETISGGLVFNHTSSSPFRAWLQKPLKKNCQK